MDNTYLSLNSKKRIELGSVLLIAAAIAAFSLLIVYLLKTANQELFTDPPPIIIKSGSFIIESEKILQPDRANERSYKNQGFNLIKGIRVVTYNENVQGETKDILFYEGKDSSWGKDDKVLVNIDIQFCQLVTQNVCTSWSPFQRVQVVNTGSDLEIKIPTELHLSKSKRNKKNKRQYKNEDENTEFIRFTMVEIINATRNSQIGNFAAKEGQEYYIGFL